MFKPGLPDSVQKGLEATKVNYVRLGSSGLRVSFPILGAMSFGETGMVKWTKSEEDSLNIIKQCYDIGINTWDTANTYSNGLSEEILGKALRKFEIPREKVVLMTKVSFHVSEDPKVITVRHRDALNKMKDYVNQGGLSRAAIFNAVEGSLKRLGTTYIDVLQIHRFDDEVPPEEFMKALHDLVQSGKVRYIGASSMWATQFAQLQFLAEKNGWTKFVSMQNYYNLCYREEEREMIRFCKETGVGIIPWSPMYAGRLARPLADQSSERSKMGYAHSPKESQADEEIINRVEKLAGEKGWKMSHVALAWHKAKGSIPIVGLNSVSRVNDVGELKDKTLTEDEVEFLEEPYVAKAVAGHK